MSKFIISKLFRTSLSPFLVSVTVVLLHLLPGSDLESSSWWSILHLDKLIHASAFSLLALSVSIALSKWRFYLGRKLAFMLIVVACGTIFGIILELLQGSVMVGRTADVLDVVADLFGSIVGIFAFRLLYGVFPGQIPIDALISNSKYYHHD